jgi:hypothetical protein
VLLTCTIAGLQNGVAYVASALATNVAGDSPASIPSQPVTPTGLPGVVAQPTAVRGDGTATVRWTAPVDPGGLAITGYIVTPIYNGVRQTGRTVAATTSSYLATGLPLGAAITFTVTAVNANGQGAPSLASQPVVAATIPTAPTFPLVTQTATGQLNVAWTPLDNGGDPVTSYVVTSTPAGHGCTTAQTSCVIGGLGLGVQYRFNVVAQNAIGTSPRSATSAPAASAIATSTIASATEVSATRLYVATPDRQVTAYARATGAFIKAVTLPCAPTSLLVDGTSLWVSCAASRTVLLLNQNLGIDRNVVVPGVVAAMSIGGPNLYVASAGSTQLTGISRTTGQVTKTVLLVVPLDLSCTATTCIILTGTGGTKVVTYTFVTKKVSSSVALPSSITKLFVLGTSVVAYGPGSATALRVDLTKLNVVTLNLGEGVLKVGGSGQVATIVTAHRVTLVNLPSFSKKSTTEFASIVKAASVDGVNVIAGDAASPWVRLVVAA